MRSSALTVVSVVIGTGIAVAIVAATGFSISSAHADENAAIEAQAEKLNDEGRELFGSGDMPAAASKIRAAIALSPQARYYYNLCFLLNAGGELEPALGACAEAKTALGANDELSERADTLIASILKNRKKAATTKSTGDKSTGSKPSPYGANGNPSKPSKKPPPDKPTVSGPGGSPAVGRAVDPNAPPPITTLPDGTFAYPPPMGLPIGVKKVAAKPRKFHVGLVSGLSGSVIDGLSESGGSRAGIMAGIYGASSFSRFIAFQGEVAYTQRGGSMREIGGDFFSSFDVTLDYITIPALTKVLLPLGSVARFHVEAGVALSFLVSSSSGGPMDEFAAADFGLLFGGGLTLHRTGGSAWIFSLRHERGLTEVEPIFELRNRTTTLMLSYGW